MSLLTDIKGEIDGNTIIVGDLNTSVTSMDRSSRQKINKATEILKDNRNVRCNTHFQDITSKKIRLYILFKCTWNVFKD